MIKLCLSVDCGVRTGCLVWIVEVYAGGVLEELSVLGWRMAPWCAGAEYLFSATGALCLDMQRQAYGRFDD